MNPNLPPLSNPATSVEINEADLVDQRTPTQPDEPVNPADRVGLPVEGGEIDEADRLDQATPLVGDDEDDYPHEQDGAGDL